MSTTIDVPANYVESGGSLNDLRVYCNNPGSTVAYFDDLLIRPVDSELSGHVYDEKTGQLIAELDKFDFATKYTYDQAGTLNEIWIESATEGWKLKRRMSYNFKRNY
jgi:YD repeat-containing protein